MDELLKAIGPGFLPLIGGVIGALIGATVGPLVNRTATLEGVARTLHGQRVLARDGAIREARRQDVQPILDWMDNRVRTFLMLVDAHRREDALEVDRLILAIVNAYPSSYAYMAVPDPAFIAALELLHERDVAVRTAIHSPTSTGLRYRQEIDANALAFRQAVVELHVIARRYWSALPD